MTARTDDIHTGTESVQNKGDRSQSSSDVDFIVNVEGTEQLSCHDIANFENTLILDEATKYRILTGHFHPVNDFKFPQQFQHGCNRTLNIDWLKKCTFLVYSKSKNSLFCLPCALFSENRRSKFVKGDDFTKFFKIKEDIEVHVGSQYSDCIEKAVGLKKRFENPEDTLPYLTDSLKAENVRKNREMLKWLIKVNILCAKQCIAFKGHREDINSNQNPGNFLATLKLLAETNEPLRGHIENPSRKNPIYLSPLIQNEITNIIGKDLLQANLVKEINRPRFFSILADEVESHHVEKLPLCIRFVDDDNNTYIVLLIQEFLEFGQYKRIDGKSIAEEILYILKKVDLDVNDSRD